MMLAFLLLSAVIPAAAQERKITPVDVDDKKPEQPIWHHYDKHGKPLKEPVLFLAELDTVQKVKSGPVYPLLTSASVGVNIFDAVMQAFGQKYASLDVWGNLSLHNWFFPTLEVGIGYGSTHPADGNFRYKARPSMYLRLGVDYNFLYKSTPKYQPFVGIRAGFSSFSYDITDVNISSDYWGQDNVVDIPRQHSTAFYGQAVAGVKVQIFNNFSLGWTARYNFMMHCKDGSNSKPWFVPGYGANNRLSATFSLIYTFPLCNYGEAEKRAEERKTLLQTQE